MQVPTMLKNACSASRSRRFLALAMLLVLTAAAQVPVVPYEPRGGRFGDPQQDSDMGMAGRIEAKRIIQLNQLRQKSMVSDAEKLLRLAEELNNDANTAALSPGDRMRKAAEIERLAKEVKDKMTYAIGTPSDPSAFPLGPHAR